MDIKTNSSLLAFVQAACELYCFQRNEEAHWDMFSVTQSDNTIEVCLSDDREFGDWDCDQSQRFTIYLPTEDCDAFGLYKGTKHEKKFESIYDLIAFKLS